MVNSQLVSVIIPIYNNNQHLVDAIESILNQTYSQIEVIIVDDGSSDGSIDTIIDSFNDERITLIKLAENVGASIARNIGISKSNGDMIAFMDADDIAAPHRINTQVVHLLDNPDIDANGSAFVMIGSANDIVVPYDESQCIAASTLFSCEILLPSMLFRRRAFDMLDDHFKSEYWPNCDWELFSRLVRIGRVENIHEILMKYRRWPEQATSKITDTTHCPATKLRSGMLEWFGIPVHEQDISAHISMAPCYWPLTVNLENPIDYNRIARWAEKIMETNKKYGRLDQKSLNMILQRGLKHAKETI